MVLEMRSRCSYICFFVGCYFLDLFTITRSILVQYLSSFFAIRIVSVQVVHPYSQIDTTAVWKKLYLVLLDKTDPLDGST